MTDADLNDMEDLERRLGALARSITEEDRRLASPPPDLFAAITTELAASADISYDAGPAEPSAPPVTVTQIQPPSHRTSDPAAGESGSALDESPTSAPLPSTVTDLDAERRRRRGRTMWTGLSFAAALAVVAVSAIYLGSRSDDPTLTGTTLAAASISNEGLPVASNQSAEATLIDVDGDLQLVVAFDGDDTSLPSDIDGFYEVWLIDENVEGMISLGVLTSDGRLDVPDGVDPAAFPVVDISVEPLDGDPTHSGQSVLRGVLDI
jgi:anti-sigma-K factor RskA